MMFDLHAGLRAIVIHLRYVLLSWLGLTLAFASAVLIGAYTLHELAYERWVPGFEQVAVIESRVATPGRATESMISSQFLLTPSVAPRLVGVAHVARVWERDADVAHAADWSPQRVMFADSAIVDVFGLRTMDGDARAALAEPGQIVLSRRLARAWYGDARAALGQSVRVRLDGRTIPLTVSAVIRDPEGPSHLDFGAIARLGRDVVATPYVFDNWASLAGRSYLRLQRDADRGAIERALDNAAAAGLHAQYGDTAHVVVRYALLPIADIHVGDPARLIDLEAKAADQVFVYGLAGVGLMIATLASVNYAALNAAFVSRRAREVALRRIVGATPQSIVWSMLAEASIVIAVSLASALGVSFAILPFVNEQLGFQLSLAPLFTPLGFGGLAAAALALGALAGALPASSLAYADSARVLAGGGGAERRRAGRQRFIIVAAQYGVSITLGALTLIGFLQVRHMREAALGYDPRGLVLVRDDRVASADLLAMLRTMPHVRQVAASSNGPGVGERNEEHLRFEGGDALNIQRVEVADGFFQAYRARLLAGVFSNEATPNEIVLNERAVRAAGFADAASVIGRSVTISGVERRVSGVVQDIRFGGLREPARAVYYVATPRTPVIAVRFEGVSDAEALAAVRDVWRRMRPEEPADVRAAEEAIISGYTADRRRNRVLAAFTGVALLLASFGAYALSAYAAERSGREMAIRRVVGADGWSIAALHVRRGVAPALLGVLFAAPIAYALSERWLSAFDARVQWTPLYIFLVAVGALALAALASVREALALAREAPSVRLRSS